MQSKSMAMVLAAALMVAPAAMAQQGTVGSPSNPGGGGTTMGQGTPGTTTTPGRVAPPDVAPNRGAAAPGTDNPPTTATPAEGANSFTEGQARSRIEAAGYTDVQGLQKDDKGVWRGRAMRNGQTAEVGLDFQGNVVTGNAAPR
ncbi:PepSY domain-containing protein [Teichococcus aestuarii]|uniref:PepSY domain-containing protein n=1 Tax=Teichococcus aestuarii TaxID=568898 RepID=A0A2U1V184_9PROT|nr:PepSY domain-containing protein [Pseudoroseomonas aestuarii]PWC27667.1 hypothetical protein CR165_16750 [Pseudoroseomonas aestuarii]